MADTGDDSGAVSGATSALTRGHSSWVTAVASWHEMLITGGTDEMVSWVPSV